MICNGGKTTPVEIDFEKAGTLTPSKCTFEYDASKYDVLYCQIDGKTTSDG